MEKTVKVRTIIGVIVDMPESIYEANKNIYTLVKDETKTEDKNENIKIEPSKAEIAERLKELKVEFKSNAKKDVLEALLNETLAKIEAEKQANTSDTNETKIDDTVVKTTDLQPEANTSETDITNTAI